jgi:hypothetical protein
MEGTYKGGGEGEGLGLLGHCPLKSLKMMLSVDMEFLSTLMYFRALVKHRIPLPAHKLVSGFVCVLTLNVECNMH